MSPLFWAFEEREKIMEFYERVSGARMHAAFYRPNDIDYSPFNYTLFLDILIFSKNSFKSLTEMFAILSTNKIWKARLVNIGMLSYNQALKYGGSGLVLRSSGFKYDLRVFKNTTYSNYWYLNFKVFLGKNGDCYDRFLIRIREMYESINIIFQVVNNLAVYFKGGFRGLGTLLGNFSNTKLNHYSKYSSMENLIEHFKYYSEGLKVPKGFVYSAVEAPKGEFGVSLISDGSNNPFRCKIRTPAFHHLQLLTKMVQGHMFADMVTILGSQDIVFGEVDR
jgi:NADH-quinone oxidoreductase subunit D